MRNGAPAVKYRSTIEPIAGGYRAGIGRGIGRLGRQLV